MNKKFFTGMIVLSLLGACNKSEVFAPETTTTPASSIFKDEHIAVSNAKLTQVNAGKVSFSFSTLYEKDIETIAVFGGVSKKNLCSFYSKKITADSHDIKDYSAIDAAAGSDINYYVIKYTTKSGDWSYSPVYEIKMK